MTAAFFTTFGDNALNAIRVWQKIGETNIAIAEKLFKAQTELATSLLDVIAMNGEEIAATKDLQEIAALQAEIAQVSGKLVLESVQSTASILADAGKVYGALCEDASGKKGPAFSKPANAPVAQPQKAA